MRITLISALAGALMLIGVLNFLHMVSVASKAPKQANVQRRVDHDRTTTSNQPIASRPVAPAAAPVAARSTNTNANTVPAAVSPRTRSESTAHLPVAVAVAPNPFAHVPPNAPHKPPAVVAQPIALRVHLPGGNRARHHQPRPVVMLTPGGARPVAQRPSAPVSSAANAVVAAPAPVVTTANKPPPVTHKVATPAKPSKGIANGKVLADNLWERYRVQGVVAKDRAPTGPCADQYSWGMLERWDRSREEFCAHSPPFQTQLHCRSFVHEHLPVPTRPHALCDATNLVLDFSKMDNAPCVKHRPGYFCGDLTYYSYKPGALLGSCKRTTGFAITKLPRDHLRDIFDSFREQTQELGVPPAVFTTPTVFVTRERGEHVNIFHTMTDFLNAFISISLLRLNSSQVQIVFLDDHKAGRYDAVWQRVFSTAGRVLRTRDFRKAASSSVLFRQAVFSPPGYTSILMGELNSPDSQCVDKSSLLVSFSHYFLSAYNLAHPLAPLPTQDPAKVQVLFISRKPYEGHTFMSRMIGNEEELIKGLKALSTPVQVTVIDFAQVSFEEQLAAVAHADVMIGMHGAGLSHLLWLPPHGGLIELRPQPGGGWHCYTHMAKWSGLVYRRWTNQQGKQRSAQGEVIPVKLSEFIPLAAEVVSAVALRKPKGQQPQQSQQPQQQQRQPQQPPQQEPKQRPPSGPANSAVVGARMQVPDPPLQWNARPGAMLAAPAGVQAARVSAPPTASLSQSTSAESSPSELQEVWPS